MGLKNVPEDPNPPFLGNFEDRRWSLTYPRLYPAVIEVYRHYAQSKWIHHVEHFLRGWCLLFENRTASESNPDVPIEVEAEITAILRAKYQYNRGGVRFDLDGAFLNTVKMLGPEADYFRRAVAKLHARLTKAQCN